MLGDMSSFRNGSLLANALLVAIGAASGAGITVLITPAVRQEAPAPLPGPQRPVKTESPAGTQALTSSAGGSASSRSEEHDAPGVLQALAITDRQERGTALRQAGADAAKRDLHFALAQADQFKSPQDKLDYLRGVYATWSKEDPRAALAYSMSSLPAGNLRSETVGIAVNRWGNIDPRGAWQWSEQNLSGALKEQALTDLMIGWTRRTPEVAAQWLASTGYKSQPLVNAAVTTWAEQDAPAAYKWARSLKDPDLRKLATPPVISEWALQDPKLAAAPVAELIANPEGPDLATTLMNIWGSTNPSEAVPWVNSLPAGDGRNEAAATLATVWAASDVDAAIKWAGTISDVTTRRQVITHIGTTLGAIDPDKGLNWLESLPPADAERGIAGAYNSWAATDTVGMSQWINAQPVTPDLDQARLSLADVLSATDINGAMTLASQIATPLGRDSAITRYFHQWRKIDEASAQDWLNANWTALAATTQQRLTQEQNRVVIAR